MRKLECAGTTLLELLLVLTLTGMLSVASVSLVIGASRAAQRSVTKLGEEQTVTTIGRFLRHELTQARASELALLASNMLTFRRMVGEAPICRTEVSAVTIAVDDWSGSRLPDPTRDKVSLLPTASPGAIIEPVLISSSNAHCPDGRTALKLTMDSSIASIWYLWVTEPVRLSVYRSNGWDWFGLAPGDGSSSVQPFAGPLRPGSGLPQLASDHLIMPGRHPAGASFSVSIPLAVPHP